nr:hypothetical protein CFP56_50732 [Quercus suber]
MVSSPLTVAFLQIYVVSEAGLRAYLSKLHMDGLMHKKRRISEAPQPPPLYSMKVQNYTIVSTTLGLTTHTSSIRIITPTTSPAVSSGTLISQPNPNIIVTTIFMLSLVVSVDAKPCGPEQEIAINAGSIEDS